MSSVPTASRQPGGRAAKETRTSRKRRPALARFILPALLVVLAVTFSVLKPETFGTWNNFKGIADNGVPVLFIAFGATLPLIVNEFDLSVGAVFTWSQVLGVGLVLEQSWSPGVAITVTLLSAVIIGLINGGAIVFFGLSSFIATLAVGSILTGVTLAYSKGEPIFGDAPEAWTDIARSEVLGIPLTVYYAAIAIIVLTIVLQRLPIGRRMYATGGNRRAAKLTGIASGRYIMATFVAAAVLSSLGGLILGAKLGAASSDTGSALLITAFAAAFLGTTAFSVGRFNIPGTVVAVFVVSVSVAGLQQFGVALWVEPVFEGVVLLVAIALAAWTTRFRALRAKAARLRELEQHRKSDDPALNPGVEHG